MLFVKRDKIGAVMAWSRWPMVGHEEELPEDHHDLKMYELEELKRDRCTQLRGAARAKVIAGLAASLIASGEEAINAAMTEAAVEKEFNTALKGFR